MTTTRTFAVPPQLDLLLTIGPMTVGRGDKTLRVTRRQALRAAHTPEGPGTIHVHLDGERATAEAWGPGASWLLDHAPGWVGCDDRPGELTAAHDLVAAAVRRFPGLRLGASGQVADVLVSTILAQKVTGEEAKRAWYGLVYRYGHDAPGGFDGLRLPPTSAEFAAVPMWAYHQVGVERRRAETIVQACSRIDRLEQASTMTSEEAERRLTSLPGLGPWTSGIVRRLCFGDPDAVEWGDYHIPNHVCWNLAGEPRGTDERMAELLSPYVGQRGRAMRLVLLAGQNAPKWGPRMPVKRLEHR